MVVEKKTWQLVRFYVCLVERCAYISASLNASCSSPSMFVLNESVRSVILKNASPRFLKATCDCVETLQVLVWTGAVLSSAGVVS